MLPCMSAFDTAAWSDLFVATAGAAAALAGLVFVAVSINISRILELAGVPERGLQTVLLLLGALVVSIFGLTPQRSSTFGIEMVAVGCVLVGWLAITTRATLIGTRGHPAWVLSRVLLVVPGSVAYLLGGISILTGFGGGLAWIVGGILGAVIGAVLNAWVLLVEILR
jgi:modulator of FtsH protease